MISKFSYKHCFKTKQQIIYEDVERLQEPLKSFGNNADVSGARKFFFNTTQN